MTERKPVLIVFDLDYTLWPFWVDTNVEPPFKKRNDKVYDSNNKELNYYPEVPDVLTRLYTEGYTLAVASRTSEIKGAQQLLELFQLDYFFSYKQIYPGSKVQHFHALKKDANVEFRDMLFFDDESRNIHEVKALGVTSVLVMDGMDTSTANYGLMQYNCNNKSRTD